MFLHFLRLFSFFLIFGAEFAHSLLDANGPARYIASVYFAMTTLTTTGYGDVTPYTVVEQLVAIAYMALGLLYFG